MHNPGEIQKEAAFWGRRKLERGASVCWKLGPLSLWVRRRHHEWWVYAKRDGPEEEVCEVIEGQQPEESVAWNRWAFTEEKTDVSLLPAAPDRSVVARPDTPLRIPPGNEVLFFVSVPLWVRVSAGDGQHPVLLTEEPTRVLSNTWFGEPTEGELCYGLKTGASVELEGVKRGSNRFVCPLLVKNHSPEELSFRKVCLPVPYVQLYRGGKRLWSNRISLSYLGKSQFSSVAFDSDAPEYENGLERVGEPRLKERRGFFRRSFDTLRSFGG